MAETIRFERMDRAKAVVTLAKLWVNPLPHVSKMAVGVGFEPTAPLGTSVFKTAALNQTQPTYRKMVFPAGFEPALQV